MQEWFNIHKSINLIHHIIKMKGKNHMILSIDVEKNIWEDSIPIYDRLNKVVIGETYLNIVKAIYIKPTANIIVNHAIAHLVDYTV